MGSIGAMRRGSRDRYFQDEFDLEAGRQREARARRHRRPRAHKGPVAMMVHQLMGGLRAGMGYCGAPTSRRCSGRPGSFASPPPASARATSTT